jgi:hypothetical protein
MKAGPSAATHTAGTGAASHGGGVCIRDGYAVVFSKKLGAIIYEEEAVHGDLRNLAGKGAAIRIHTPDTRQPNTVGADVEVYY